MSKIEAAPPSLFVVVPARKSSTRLPNKPLAMIGDSPMVAHVLNRAQKLCALLMQTTQFPRTLLTSTQVILATDDETVAVASANTQAVTILTPPELASGTDRIAWALHNLKQPPGPRDLVLNIQGDEPFFSLVDAVALLHHMLNIPDEAMGTLVKSRHSWQAFLSPSVVKAVRSASGHGLYFSRAPIPWPRSSLGGGGIEWIEQASKKGRESQIVEPHLFWQHLGIYAFRYEALCQFANHLPKDGLEITESLEQLRAIEAGWKLALVEAFDDPLGVDTPEDLEVARIRWESENGKVIETFF